MASATDDLRATQDSITADTERLKALEERKRQLDEGDPALVELSAEAEAVSTDMRRKTSAERELVDEVQVETD